MLRPITHLLPGEFFATDRDMLKACNRANLARFMQFTAWHHPNIYEGELPSHTACFQSLAQAIVENTPICAIVRIRSTHDGTAGKIDFGMYSGYFLLCG